MKKIILAIMFVLASVSASAQLQRVNGDIMMKSIGEAVVNKSGPKAHFNIDVNYPEDMIVEYFYVQSVSRPYMSWKGGMEPHITFDMEEDTYFFIFTGVRKEGGRYIMITPDVEAKGDVNLSYDFSSCQNSVEFIPVLPDGRDGFPDTWNEDGSALVYEGNIDSGVYRMDILRRDFPTCGFDAFSFMSQVELGYKQLKDYGGFRCNDIGPDFEICNRQEIFTRADELIEMTHTINAAEVRGDTLLRNDPAKYVRLDANYGIPPAGPYDVTDGDYYRISTNLLSSGFKTMISMGIDQKITRSILLCQNLCKDGFIKPLTGYGKDVADNGYKAEKRDYYPIFSPEMTLDGSKATFYTAHIKGSSASIYWYINIPEYGVPFYTERPYTEHPRFKWEWDFASGEYPTFGNSTPSLTIETLLNKDYNEPHIGGFYLGRLGESRVCDEQLSWVTVERNGETVKSCNMIDLGDWFTTEFSRGVYSGNYRISIENDNVTVDDEIPGLNTTVITIADAGLDDREPPTLTMLNFRDGKDDINDRFSTPVEGTLEFTAVDLASEIGESDVEGYQRIYYLARPLETLKVEYSPMGSDSFRELPVTEVPELFHMPEFGYFYRGSLASVTEGSADGWFKIRISMSDAVGNSQVQTIEPAFYIESAKAGIDGAESESGIRINGDEVMAAGSVSIYDALGRLVRSGDDRVSISGMKGIYIIKTSSDVMKVVL